MNTVERFLVAIVAGIFLALAGWSIAFSISKCGWASLWLGRSVFWAALFGYCD